MGSRYNSRPLAAEVLIDGGEARLVRIREREPIEELWRSRVRRALISMPQRRRVAYRILENPLEGNDDIAVGHDVAELAAWFSGLAAPSTPVAALGLLAGSFALSSCEWLQNEFVYISEQR
jgi:hypothetical protein